MGLSLSRFKSLLIDSRAAIRLWRSNIFDARLYSSVHKDLGKMLPIFHWTRYGQQEDDRLIGITPLCRWIGKPVLKGELSPGAARRIGNHVKADTLTQDMAENYGLNYYDFKFLQLFAQSQYDQARLILEHCSDEVLLDGAYDFAQKRMDFTPLTEVLTKYNELIPDRVAHTRKLADISQALGQINNQYMTTLRLGAKNGSMSADEQFFKARLPIVGVENADKNLAFQRLLTAGLYKNLAQTSARIAEFTQNIKGFEDIINCASHNGLYGDRPLCVLPRLDNENTVVPLGDWKGAVVKFRVLMPQYWVAPQCNHRVTGQVLVFHKRMIEFLFARNIALVPIFASPLYDISHEYNFGLPTLSYHSVSKDNGLPCLHYKESYLPDIFTTNEMGYSGWSSLAMDFTIAPVAQDKASAFQTQLFEQYVNQGLTKYQQDDNVGDEIKAGFIFIALQVPDDTVSALSYMPRDEWVETVCEFGDKHNIDIVIKAHPMDKFEHTKALLVRVKKRPYVHISTANIHEIISKSMAVVTCNSGVGFEALIHQKPVIVTGRSDYQSVCYQAKTKVDLTRAMKDLSWGQGKISTTDIDKFLYHYYHENCLKIDLPIHGALTDFCNMISRISY